VPADPRRKPSRPFGDRVDPNQPGQVGRRPPVPGVPIMTGLMWIIVGVVILVWFTAGWKWAVGIVCIGVGLLFLRGGLVAYVRQRR
jgi:hypothetical protein